MRHLTHITPMNSSYSTGMNSFFRMEESEYLADTGRSVFAKSPDDSWFKMKSSATQTPYLEPAFFGLMTGDIITVTFDALVLSGTSEVTVNFLQLNASTTGGALNNALPSGSLKSHYKPFKVKCVVNEFITGGLGVVLNIRPTGMNSEIIVKNIEVTIESANNQFSLKNNVVSYKDKTDFMNLIQLVTGTNIRTSYNTLYSTLFIGNNITFPDDATMSFSGGSTGAFRGVAALFNGNKYRNPIAIYAEIKLDDTDGISVTANEYDASGSFIKTSSNTPILTAPTGGVFKKKIIFLQGDIDTSRKTFVDMGRSIAQSVSYKNVRMSRPQFDDHSKRNPNELDELYSNLGLKLR